MCLVQSAEEPPGGTHHTQNTNPHRDQPVLNLNLETEHTLGDTARYKPHANIALDCSICPRSELTPSLIGQPVSTFHANVAHTPSPQQRQQGKTHKLDRHAHLFLVFVVLRRGRCPVGSRDKRESSSQKIGHGHIWSGAVPLPDGRSADAK